MKSRVGRKAAGVEGPSVATRNLCELLGRGVEQGNFWLAPFLTAEEQAYAEELDARERAEVEGAAFDRRARRSSARRR